MGLSSLKICLCERFPFHLFVCTFKPLKEDKHAAVQIISLTWQGSPFSTGLLTTHLSAYLLLMSNSFSSMESSSKLNSNFPWKSVLYPCHIILFCLICLFLSGRILTPGWDLPFSLLHLLFVQTFFGLWFAPFGQW